MLAHRTDFALKSIVPDQFSGFEAAAFELKLALLFGTMSQLLAHLAHFTKFVTFLLQFVQQPLIALVQLPYPFADQALLRRLFKPALELLATPPRRLQFERRLPLAGAEPLVAIEVAQRVDRPLKAAAVAGLQPMRIELALGPLVLHVDPLEFTLGTLECDPADHCPHGLVKLALRYLPILELASLLP
ncbi:MAG: hypothetical protein ACLQU2_09735 [Candidatus Binataceae bacterium]